jgi:hypothetical protein
MGTREDYLCIHDYEERKSFRKKPDETGFVRDLYRFKSNPDNDMDMDIERALAKVDDDGAQVLSKLEREVSGPGPDHAFHEPDENELLVLLHYACIMYLRSPAFRRLLKNLASSQATLDMRLKAHGFDSPEELREELARTGLELSLAEASDLLSFMKSPDFRVQVDDPDWLLLQSFSGEEEILRLLRERAWSLWVAEKGQDSFITSDCPLALLWKKAHPVGFRPGFAHRDTHIFFPLTKRLLLYGSYEGEGGLIEASRTQAAVANHVMVSTSGRFVYSPEKSFLEQDGGTERVSPGPDYARDRMW